MSSRTCLSAVVNATASSTSTAPPPRAPDLVLAAAMERVRSGTFGPEDARHLLDELWRRGTRVPVRVLNGFLAALTKAPPSAACSNGPALAVTFFNGMSRAAGPRVLSLSLHTYGILMDCCNSAHHLGLALDFFGRLLRTGLGVSVLARNYMVFLPRGAVLIQVVTNKQVWDALKTAYLDKQNIRIDLDRFKATLQEAMSRLP